MAIRDDWVGLIASWGKLSPILKIVAVVLFVMSALSIASLADSVFALKGFIAAAINFYRTVASPIVAFLESLFRIHLEQQLFDLVAAAILINSATGKANYAEAIADGVTVPRLPYIVFQAIFLLIWIVVAVILFLFSPTLGLAMATVWLPLWWLIRGYIMSKIFRREPTYVERVDRRTSVYILTVYPVVAILAAISAGLAKPLPT